MPSRDVGESAAVDAAAEQQQHGGPAPPRPPPQQQRSDDGPRQTVSVHFSKVHSAPMTQVALQLVHTAKQVFASATRIRYQEPQQAVTTISASPKNVNTRCAKSVRA